MRRWLTEGVSLGLIALTVVLFFAKLFWPQPQLLVTPDFGRSDAWHFSFSGKYFLAQSLKSNSLPLWTAKLGGGFPLLAEGQIGTFFLPNLVFYKFLDTVTAYNLTLALAILFLGWGTYFWLRRLGLSQVPATFGGLTLAFSGPAITGLTHLALLQTISLLPWVMLGTTLLVQNKSWWSVLLLTFLLSQQLFAGFPQASFLTLIFASGLFIWLIWHRIKPAFDIIRFVASLVLALGLSAIQLLPSWEFLLYSTRPTGFTPPEAAYFSYPLKHLLTLFNPYQLGNPKLATYPIFSSFDGSIFWENSGYIGILPLVAAGWFLVSARGNHWRYFFLITLFVSFLLMLGSHSPLYLIYSFWPFNLFRVPSRALWIFVTVLTVAGAFGLQIIWNKLVKFTLPRSLLILFLGFNFYMLISPWSNYHSLVPAQDWLARPQTLAWFSPQSRSLALGSQVSYNQIFLKTGWQDPRAYYFLRNLIAPDSNLIWKVASAEVYAGRSLARQAIFSSLLEAEIKLSGTVATVSSTGTKFLSLASVDNLMTTLPLDQTGLIVKQVLSENRQTLTHYVNPPSLPQAYLATKVATATTAEEASQKMTDASFLPGASVLLPQSLPAGPALGKPKINLDRPRETETIVEVIDNPAQAILVLNDTYYPGWEASVDGKKVSIYPANITFRAVALPAGNHRVVFTFRPKSFYWGTLISAATILGITSAVVFLQVFAAFRIQQKVAGPGSRRRRSRDR